MKLFYIILLFSCSTIDQQKIEYSCKAGQKVKCLKSKCEEYCRKLEAYDDPNYIKSENSDNPFEVNPVEEQVEFGHGN